MKKVLIFEADMFVDIPTLTSTLVKKLPDVDVVDFVSGAGSFSFIVSFELGSFKTINLVDEIVNLVKCEVGKQRVGIRSYLDLSVSSCRFVEC